LQRIVRPAVTGLVVLLAAGLLDPAGAVRRLESDAVDIGVDRPARAPFTAIVSLRTQRVTIYDAAGRILRGRVSTGQAGYETPVGIYSVLQKEEFHISNLYDDAEMPFMQRLTWSGIALHAGQLPGYPASHGCIRLPYELAERLFDLTPIGMRVIVARNDIYPTAIDHPALFEPAVPLSELQSIAAAKAAEAQAAARRADAARLTAARLAGEAVRPLPAAESAKTRAAWRLAVAEGAVRAASTPLGIRHAAEARAQADAALAEAEMQLATARTEAPLKAAAAAKAREEVSAAEAEKLAAAAASREAAHRTAPVSVLVSRKTARLYVRQAFREIFESPVTIRDVAMPIGTHIYTALDTTDGGTGLRWNVVTLSDTSGTRQARRGEDDALGMEPMGTSQAETALDRIEIPQESIDRIAAMMSPGSSLIVSDEAMSGETGKDTDFVILMSGEPQGGIKRRRPAPQARSRDDLEYDRRVRRSAVPPPIYWDAPYGRW
jgi:hypothetical protein